MAQGKKYDESVKQRAVTLVASGVSVRVAAARVGAGESTVRGWLASIKKDDSKALAELREKKKAAFASMAWAGCEASLRLVIRRIDLAEHELEKLEAFIEELIEIAARQGEITKDERLSILRKLCALRVDDVGKLVALMGTLYDKSELAAGGPTGRVEIRDARFEDL